MAGPARKRRVTSAALWDEAPKGGVIPILIVSYRTPGDIRDCLASLDTLQADPPAAIFICENGGPAAWESLCRTLLAPNGGCVRSRCRAPRLGTRLGKIACLELAGSGRTVFVAQATGNLGYSGGLNAWLEPLMDNADWPGCWILNPDALASADSLAALLAETGSNKLGLTGSRLTDRLAHPQRGIVGLCWQRLLARTAAVTMSKAATDHRRGGPAARSRITSPSGASVYITRRTLTDIYPLDERYFLFFEDVDWGVRATRAGHRVGYAFDSVVAHLGGGSTGTRSFGYGGSRLSVYLSFRNRLLFVQTHYPGWFAYTSLLSVLHAVRVAPHGAFIPAIKGIAAGLRGETGRPDWLIDVHVVPHGRGSDHVRQYETIDP